MVCNITLTKGTWIVFGLAKWVTSFSDLTQMRLAGNTIRCGNGLNGGGQSITVIHKIESESATLTLEVYQNAAENKDVERDSYLRAVRII
jgi:hypothetical protein